MDLRALLKISVNLNYESKSDGTPTMSAERLKTRRNRTNFVIKTFCLEGKRVYTRRDERNSLSGFQVDLKLSRLILLSEAQHESSLMSDSFDVSNEGFLL